MTRSSIGVGIVGASMERGWAKTAHIPALAALDEYEIRGVSARRQETADQSARELGLDLAFTDHRHLVERPEIDLVVVTVKVPDHLAVVQDAVAAGKMIYCEWPLGRSLQEAAQMAALADTRGVDTVIGLQGGMSPWLRYVRTLLEDGAIGQPVSTSLRAHVPGGQWTGQLRYWQDFTKDSRNGATMLTIAMGHAFEPLTQVLGDVASLSAISVRRRPAEITVEGVPDVTDAPDEVIVAATLDSGVVASIHYSAGAATVGKNLVWEIVGESGHLVISADGGYVHIDDVTVTLGRPDSAPRTLPVPQEPATGVPGLTGPAANVARLYRRLARQQHSRGETVGGGERVPDFASAVRRHRVIDAIEKSSVSGERQTLTAAARQGPLRP